MKKSLWIIGTIIFLSIFSSCCNDVEENVGRGIESREPLKGVVMEREGNWYFIPIISSVDLFNQKKYGNRLIKIENWIEEYEKYLPICSIFGSISEDCEEVDDQNSTNLRIRIQDIEAAEIGRTRANVSDFNIIISLLHSQKEFPSGWNTMYLYCPTTVTLGAPGSDRYPNSVFCHPLFLDQDNKTLVDFRLVHYQCNGGAHTIRVTNSIGYETNVRFSGIGYTYNFSDMIPLNPDATTVITVEIIK